MNFHAMMLTMWQTKPHAGPRANSKPSGGTRVDSNACRCTIMRADFSYFAAQILCEKKSTGDTYICTPTKSCILKSVFTGYIRSTHCRLIKKDTVFQLSGVSLRDIVALFLKSRFVSIQAWDLSDSCSGNIKAAVEKTFPFTLPQQKT